VDSITVTICGRCTEVCPHHIAPSENILLLRARQVASNRAPRAVTGLVALVETSRKGILPSISKRRSFLEEQANTRQARVGLFVGCNFDYDVRLTPVAKATVQILQKIGVDLAIPSEQVCCGAPLEEVGAYPQVKELVVKNVEVFRGRVAAKS